MKTAIQIPDHLGNLISLELPENLLNLSHSLQQCIALPAVIDPHVHFRTPGLEYKENWTSGAKAAYAGGVTTVFDMPNVIPPTITHERLLAKKQLIDEQLKLANLPLRYHLFFGADKQNFSEISKVKDEIIGIKVFMGCSTGDLVMDDDESLDTLFSLASEYDLLVAVHAEDEKLMQEQKLLFKHRQDYAVHSCIRNEKVAAIAVEKAILLSEKYKTRLYVLHTSTSTEIDLIKAAKKSKIPVFAEITPHHLFLNDQFYQSLGGKAQVNPPLRAKHHQAILFSAIQEGVIDTIGSDHAPHSLLEKQKPYGECPSGMPGIEFLLPLLLNSYHQQQLSLKQIVSLTSANAQQIFRLTPNNDWVLVNLNQQKLIQSTKSRAGWSPYMGMELTGWPLAVVQNNEWFMLN